MNHKITCGVSFDKVYGPGYDPEGQTNGGLFEITPCISWKGTGLSQHYECEHIETLEYTNILH